MNLAYRRGSALAAILVLAGCVRAAPPSQPPRVMLVDNGRAADAPPSEPRSEPALRPVSDAVLARALSGVAENLAFADYPFSGCHDRAHATYMALAHALGPDAVAKIWLFGPRLLTVALDGAIGVKVDAARWGTDHTSWDYHVAVVVQTTSGFAVVDPGQGRADRAQTLDAWFASMTIPPGSVWSIVDGRYYSFNTTGAADWSGGRRPFNGSLFEYDRTAQAERWLQKNLARDDVAVELAATPTACPELVAALREPTRLFAGLESVSPASPGCAPFVAKFERRVEHWTARIEALHAGPITDLSTRTAALQPAP